MRNKILTTILTTALVATTTLTVASADATQTLRDIKTIAKKLKYKSKVTGESFVSHGGMEKNNYQEIWYETKVVIHGHVQEVSDNFETKVIKYGGNPLEEIVEFDIRRLADELFVADAEMFDQKDLGKFKFTNKSRSKLTVKVGGNGGCDVTLRVKKDNGIYLDMIHTTCKKKYEMLGRISLTTNGEVYMLDSVQTWAEHRLSLDSKSIFCRTRKQKARAQYIAGFEKRVKANNKKFIKRSFVSKKKFRKQMDEHYAVAEKYAATHPQATPVERMETPVKNEVSVQSNRFVSVKAIQDSFLESPYNANKKYRGRQITVKAIADDTLDLGIANSISFVTPDDGSIVCGGVSSDVIDVAKSNKEFIITGTISSGDMFALDLDDCKIEILN